MLTILIALSQIVLSASAMSDNDKIRLAMAVEHVSLESSSSSGISSAHVNIVGWNNDMKVTVVPSKESEEYDTAFDLTIAILYIAAVNKYSDLGNLSITYENSNGVISTASGLRSWARKS